MACVQGLDLHISDCQPFIDVEGAKVGDSVLVESVMDVSSLSSGLFQSSVFEASCVVAVSM